MTMIAIGDTFSTFRASMTRSRASSSPSRMLKSINNSGLVRLSMLNLDWKGGEKMRELTRIYVDIFFAQCYISRRAQSRIYFFLV